MYKYGPAQHRSSVVKIASSINQLFRLNKLNNISIKMNTFIAACFLAVVACAFARPEEKYTDKYDSTDIHEVAKNERILKNYYTCMIGEHSCPPEAEELKKVLPDALKTECAKCTDKQKEGAKVIFKVLYQKHRDWFDNLAKIYDPEGIYLKAHESELKAL